MQLLICYSRDYFREFDQDDYSPEELYSHYVKNKGLYILSLQSDDNDFFATSIIDGQPVTEFGTMAQEKLFHAKEVFTEKLAACSESQIISFIEKIAATSVLVYMIKNSTEAAMIFETTNDRGKPLTNLEKTKSFLMYKAAVGLEDPSQMLDRIQTRFNAIYKDYTAIEPYGIDENAILQYSFIAYEPWTNKGKKKEYQHYMDTMKGKADEYVKNLDAEGLQSFIDRYTGNVQQTFTAIRKMFTDRCKEFQEIDALGRVATFLPLLVKCYRMDQSKGKDGYRKICRLCEIFSFRVYVIFEYMSNKLQTSWYELAKAFEGDFDELAVKIVGLIKSVESDEKFIERLSGPNFYGNHSTMERNYFFWKYENYLRACEQPVATPMSYEDLQEKRDKKLTLTIEHIVAQRNSDEQSRVVSDQLCINVGRAKYFNENYLNSIGNLTIDPQSANSSKGKGDVQMKINKYFTMAPYKCQNELILFMDNGRWTLNSIEERKKKLLVFAKKTWCDFTAFVADASKVKTIIEQEDATEDAEE